MAENVAQLVPTKPDAERAKEYRAQFIEAMQPVLTMMGAAARDGFEFQFNIVTDATGNPHIQALHLVKRY